MEDGMKRIFYHGGCLDGTAAAWVASKRFGENNVALTPVSYGRKPPTVHEEDEVYLLDFCYPPHELHEMAKNSKGLVVIDHHKSNSFLEGIELYNGEVRYDMDHSGAVLAWNYFFPFETVPLLLRYVEDRDIWKWELNHSREVSAYLQSLQLTPQSFGHEVIRMYAELSDHDHKKVFQSTAYREGKAILRSHEILSQSIARTASLKNFCGYKVPVVCSPVLHSEVGHELLEAYPDAPFAVTYRDVDGIRSFSLRSEDSREDVSVIAKENGGGGHRNASGFEVKLDDKRIKYGEED
jgi:oligoribonuclease NrnB/cAMP/cGMP phosphodiesterase (DHH superfamily)